MFQKSNSLLYLMHKQEVEQLKKILHGLYPNPKSELDFCNDYQLIVAVILSAQCTDKKVNQVTPALFTKYPDFQQLAQASIEDLENIIRPINYYKTKAKNLIGMANSVSHKHQAMLPTTRVELEELPGVGRKTASVILSEKNIEPALAVDTHVFRVSKRMGLAKSDSREAVEEEIKHHFSPHLWRNVHHWLILHGRRVCKAQNPACKECMLFNVCKRVGISQFSKS